MLVLALAVLLVEGYFVYRFYDKYYNVASAPQGSMSSAEQERTWDESAAPAVDGAIVVQRAASDNIVDNSTYLDHPSTNADPDAVLMVTRVLGPGEDTDYVHEIGVWYDRFREDGRWAVFNQDLVPLPEGSWFEVSVLEGPNKLVHRAEPFSTSANVTYVDDPLTNGDPNAELSVTQNWNPGGGAGTYNDHPVGVRYDQELERWAIFNEDGADMPQGAAFNVAVSEGS